MTFSGHIHRDAGDIIRLELAGDIRGSAVGRLHGLLITVIVNDLPAHLVVDLGAVTYLSDAGILMLTHGCATAVEYGIGYRVIHAHGQARLALQDSGVQDWLAASDDLGALVLALLSQPASSPRR